VNEILLIILLLATGTWLAAAIGAAIVAFVKKGSGAITTLVLGFAAGVILMVSFVELIHPAIHKAETYSSLPTWIIVPGAFTAGFFCTLLLDLCISHLRGKRGNDFKYKQGVVLLSVLSVHSVPEGLALGILLGALGRHFYIDELMAVVPIAIAIGLHKLPEGTAISVAFQKEGMTKLKSFLLGQASGFLGFLSGIVGFIIAISINAILPYAMGFAGGAMIWVAVHELIPHNRGSAEKRSPYLATIGIFLGVLLMLFVDTTIHNHQHYQCHLHEQSEQSRPWLFP